MGFSDAAITGPEGLGLDHLDTFADVREKDIPSMIKELRRSNILIRQTSQNYLQALCYWVVHQRLQVNYLPEDFTEPVMHIS